MIPRNMEYWKATPRSTAPSGCKVHLTPSKTEYCALGIIEKKQNSLLENKLK